MIVEVSHCRSCGSGTRSDDRYCQDCGSFLHDDGAEPDKIVKAIEPSDFLVRLSPGAAKPVVALPVVTGLIVLAALIPVLVYVVNNSYQAISLGYLEREAAQQLAQGQPDQTLAIIDRVSLSHKLSPSQKQLLNTACFRLADQHIANSKYDAALSMLSRITPEFAQFDQVKERSQVCRDCLSQQQVVLKSSGIKPHIRARSRLPKIDTQIELNKEPRQIAAQDPSAASGHIPSKPFLPDMAATRPAPKETTATTVKPTPKVPIATPAQSISQAASGAISDAAPKAVNTGEGKKAMMTTDNLKSAGPDNATDNEKHTTNNSLIPHYTHNDVARYNELLAAYFSSKHAASKEPPSINEWVHAGRPKF